MQSSAIETQKCPYCATIHQGTCPRIKAIEYHENGTVKRVEFHAPAMPDWDFMRCLPTL